MGMYDTIRCEWALPDPAMQEREFQTKNLDCLMDEYVITRGGRLVKHEWDWEETPQAERPYPNAAPGSIESICGIIRKVKGSERLVDTCYHGELYFYGSERGREQDPNAWYDYIATFAGGALMGVQRIETT